ncbi:MAG: V-type ATP synthase subunit I, partial [Thermoclostridium sp.]|nr:V-type ATP synthase subunit I [Thermoclostridium sp.]
MSKITLLGMEEEREDLIKSLMNFGAVEINTLDAEDYEELADNPVVQEDLSSVEAQLAKVHTAIDSMNKYCPEKKGLFQSRRVITISEFEKLNQDRKSTWGTVDKIKEQEEKLTALKAEENKLLNLQQSLAPWKGLTAPLEAVGTHKTNFQYGTIPSAVSWDLTQPEFTEKFPFSVLERINSDKDQHYIYFITHTDSADECLSFLKARGYSRVTFQGLSG